MNNSENNTPTDETPDRRYRDEQFLKQKYEVEGLSQEEIAELCNCDSWTVGRHMKKHDIKARSPSERAANRPATFCTSAKGYERWEQEIGGKWEYVYVHRLLATLKVDDLSELEGMHVHHQNRCPFDNRPDNIEVLAPEQHAERHADD